MTSLHSGHENDAPASGRTQSRHLAQSSWLPLQGIILGSFSSSSKLSRHTGQSSAVAHMQVEATPLRRCVYYSGPTKLRALKGPFKNTGGRNTQTDRYSIAHTVPVHRYSMPGSYVRKTLKTRFSIRMAGTKMEAIHVHLALGTIRELYDRAIYTLLGFAIGLLFCV